jgi:hypothetical protein
MITLIYLLLVPGEDNRSYHTQNLITQSKRKHVQTEDLHAARNDLLMVSSRCDVSFINNETEVVSSGNKHCPEIETGLITRCTRQE